MILSCWDSVVYSNFSFTSFLNVEGKRNEEGRKNHLLNEWLRNHHLSLLLDLSTKRSITKTMNAQKQVSGGQTSLYVGNLDPTVSEVWKSAVVLWIDRPFSGVQQVRKSRNESRRY